MAVRCIQRMIDQLCSDVLTMIDLLSIDTLAKKSVGDTPLMSDDARVIINDAGAMLTLTSRDQREKRNNAKGKSRPFPTPAVSPQSKLQPQNPSMIPLSSPRHFHTLCFTKL